MLPLRWARPAHHLGSSVPFLLGWFTLPCSPAQRPRFPLQAPSPLLSRNEALESLLSLGTPQHPKPRQPLLPPSSQTPEATGVPAPHVCCHGSPRRLLHSHHGTPAAKPQGLCLSPRVLGSRRLRLPPAVLLSPLRPRKRPPTIRPGLSPLHTGRLGLGRSRATGLTRIQISTRCLRSGTGPGAMARGSGRCRRRARGGLGVTLIPSDPRCASGVGTRPSPAQARRGSDGSSPRSVWDRPAPRGGDQPPGVSEPPPRPLLSARFTSEGTRPGPAGSAPAPRAPAQTAPAAASSRSAPRRDPPAPPRPAPTWGKPGSGSKVSRAGQGPEAEAQRTSGAQRAAMLERRRRRRGASWVPAAAPVGWGRGPGRAAEGPPARPPPGAHRRLHALSAAPRGSCLGDPAPRAPGLHSPPGHPPGPRWAWPSSRRPSAPPPAPGRWAGGRGRAARCRELLGKAPGAPSTRVSPAACAWGPPSRVCAQTRAAPGKVAQLEPRARLRSEVASGGKRPAPAGPRCPSGGRPGRVGRAADPAGPVTPPAPRAQPAAPAPLRAASAPLSNSGLWVWLLGPQAA